MKRIAIAVIAGLVAWTVAIVLLNMGLRLALPGYQEAEPGFAFTTGMRLARLAIASVATLAAGVLAARLTPGDRRAPLWLGIVLLVFFAPVHAGLWDKFPIWYHLVFLASLVPLTLAGGRLRSTRPTES